ncbi:MAG: DUF2975 domain-containing protein [Bacteroidota bacterium]
MKKRFHKNKIATLTVLAGLVYIFLIFSRFFSASESFLLGWYMGSEETQIETRDGVFDAQHIYDLEVKPRGSVLGFPEHVSGTGDALYPVRISSMKVPLIRGSDVPGEIRKYQVIRGFVLFFSFVLFVILPVRFFRLLSQLKQNDVFNRLNIRWIRQIGWILILLYFFEWGVCLLDKKIHQLLFEFSDYTISGHIADSLLLLLGVVILLAGEIFARGVSLKEEQQLTI